MTYAEYTQAGWRLYHTTGYAELFLPRPGSIYATHMRALVRWVDAVTEAEKYALFTKGARSDP